MSLPEREENVVLPDSSAGLRGCEENRTISKNMTMYTLAEHESPKFAEFLSLTKPWQGAYTDATFSFIAVKDGGRLRLVQGHVILPSNAVPQALQLQTPSVCACAVSLSTLGLDCEALIHALLRDELETPIGTLSLIEQEGVGPQDISVYFPRYPDDFNSSREHALSLTLSCGRMPFGNRQAEFRNDLRTAQQPYDSIVELANELWLKPLRWDTCTLDISAHSPVAIDLTREIIGGKVRLALLALRGIDVTPARFGYRVVATGSVVQRRTLAATELAWSAGAGERIQVGEIDVRVPDGAIVQCFASYDGLLLQQGFVVQPGILPNVRRMTHEVFDPALENTKKCLFDAKTQKQDARNLEAGVANLLYMLGFAVDPLFGKPQSNNPDLIATAPSGDVLVVECTTAAIDIEGKLSKLLARTAALREKLAETGNSHIRCLPVIVTSLAETAITNMEEAVKARILVVSAEDLGRALDSTMVPQNADALFNEKWHTLNPPPDPLFPDGIQPVSLPLSNSSSTI